MIPTRSDLRRWLLSGKEKGCTHMIVACDTFSWEDYPVYVEQGQDVREVEAEYKGENMQKVMEVYSFNHDIEAQLSETRAFHYD